MTWKILLYGGLLGAPFLALSVDDLTFAPAEGSTATRTWQEETELELVALVYAWDDQEKEQEGGGLVVRNERRLVLTDRHLEVADGRIAKLERTYETLTSLTTASAHDEKSGAFEAQAHGASALEGATVVFTWDDEDDTYVAAFAEGDAGLDEELLDGLTAAANLAPLLPPAGTEEGDDWEVEPAALAALLRFAGEISLAPDLSDGGAAKAAFPGFLLCLAECGAELEGDLEVTWVGTEENDEGTLAALSLELDVSATRDASDAMAGLLSTLGYDEKGRDRGTAELRSAFEGEGTLLWNLERGVAQRLELEGDLEIEYFTVNDKGGIEYSTTMTYAGTAALTVDVE